MYRINIFEVALDLRNYLWLVAKTRIGYRKGKHKCVLIKGFVTIIDFSINLYFFSIPHA